MGRTTKEQNTCTTNTEKQTCLQKNDYWSVKGCDGKSVQWSKRRKLLKDTKATKVDHCTR